MPNFMFIKELAITHQYMGQSGNGSYLQNWFQFI